jgi:choice-of-anchor C domain-containing protein
LFVTSLAATLISVGPASGQNLVINGDFELPFIAQDFFTYQAPITFSNWTVSQNSVDLTSTTWQPASGRQSVDLSGSGEGPFNGSLYQDVATTPSQMYRLRFALAGNPFAGCGGTGPKPMHVDFAGALVANLSFDSTGHSPTNMGWQYFEFSLIAPTSVSRLRFTSDINACAGPTIDDVSLTVIPEPATVIPLALAAIGGIGPVSRRRFADNAGNAKSAAWGRRVRPGEAYSWNNQRRR